MPPCQKFPIFTLKLFALALNIVANAFYTKHLTDFLHLHFYNKILGNFQLSSKLSYSSVDALEESLVSVIQIFSDYLLLVI